METTPTTKPGGRGDNGSSSPTKSGRVSYSPNKSSSSTRVIESLHRQIDELKLELLDTKSRNEELKKKNEIVQKRRDQLVEQLSNAKHDNEVVSSMLDRKERRVADLEEQLQNVSSCADDYKWKFKNLETRCDKLRENESRAVSELERIKIAYDIIVASQKEYRSHYDAQVKELKKKLEEYISDKDTMLQKNISLINKSDATIFRSIKAITLRSREIEERYVKRDQILAESLAKLRNSVSLNTQDIQVILKSSKDLFEEVCHKLNIDKKTLMESYLHDCEDHINPFEEQEEAQSIETSQGGEPLGSERESSRVQKIKEEPIVVKKRGERTVSVETAEERIRKLSKDLNNRIPSSDRVTPLDPHAKTRHRRNGTSPTDDNNAGSSSNSRRSSALFDGVSSNFTVATDVSRKTSSSRNPSSHSRNASNVDNFEELSKKKKRRRRRKKGSKKTDTDGEKEGEEDLSGLESN